MKEDKVLKKLSEMQERVDEFERIEEKFDHLLEAKLLEVRMVAYLILIIVSILFAFSIGSLLKTLGF